MWCEHEGADTKERMRDMITYFEGTCEFCLGNMGIDQYKKELSQLKTKECEMDEETIMLLYYVDSVIDYKVENFTDAFDKWEKAKKIAEKTGNEEFLGKIYSYFSIYYYFNREAALSKEYFDKATEIFRRHKLYSELSLHYINILWYKRYEEDKTEVMEYLDRALHYVQLSDSKKDARVYLHLGYIYKTIFNDFISGFKHLTMAREMCYQNGNYEMECMAFHVLADGYMQLGHFEQAVKIYRDILDTERYRDITPNLKCMLLGNLIPAYMKVQQFDKAAVELDNMDAYVPQTQVNMREQFGGVAKWLRAQLYISSGHDIEQADKMLQECEELYKNRRTVFPVDNFDFCLAGCFGDLYMLRGEYAKAAEAYSKQFDLSGKYGAIAKMQAVGNLSSAYERLGNYQAALMYRKERMDLFDQIEQEKLINQYDRLYKEFFRGVQEENIKQLNETGEKLEYKGSTDDLTGLYNRHSFEELISEQKMRKNTGNIGLIFTDIDFFKNYNDCFGHAKGDECLQKVAETIKETIKPVGGVAYRYGGEEFIAVIPGYSLEKTHELAERIVGNVRNLKRVHPGSDVSPVVTISAGVSAGNRADIEQLIKQADKLLYKVKKNGRNAVAAE